ncbi:unnamed protein product [Brassica oleracea]
MCVNVMTSLRYPQIMLSAVPTQILQNNIPRIPSKSLQVILSIFSLMYTTQTVYN